MTPSIIESAGAVLFAVAILHTFSAQVFERLAQRYPAHAGIWHLLGEVEVVFGFWAMVLVAFIAITGGTGDAVAYVDSRNFTEPMFVFVIMVIAATRPILQTMKSAVALLARAIPLPDGMVTYFLVLAGVPLLGSFITEPAAMTLAALILSERIFASGISERLKYATLGVLFVNVSIGGTLTPYAAPPVLMVAAKWGWDLPFMLSHIGWKAALAVIVNAAGVTALFARELAALRPGATAGKDTAVPLPLVLAHLAFLAGVVLFAHHPAVFMGLFLFFLGVAHAYERFQDRLILREGLLVAFFLAGLVVLGGQQQWWLQPVLMSMSSDAVFYGATALTAVTDNAALTYLGSLVEGLSDEFKYALVTGAVAGGGLTVIANAPNPAGMSILKGHFALETVSALHLLLAALLPTAVAIAAFRLL
ncbi:putative Na+/H+ antiporter [Pseudoduganella sp. SL102]|uniref:putative Na+/H+ antiporter n=1 Tax=Pseudoduganella sp. SL102 TaxID=2995154 RepID=UPI00248B5B54|nr:putative Na+/H+ antiporter [Pseudoduganella sp. SL102]WBS04119.1 putative Na+/H+ antiporter [Pseudoduganella sp. SL102]